MLFNSAAFTILLIVTFLLYWFYANGNKYKQNIILLLASYVFYFSWEPAFLLLVISTTTLALYGGQIIEKLQNHRFKKAFFVTLVILVITPLFIFKYLNFINALLFSIFNQTSSHQPQQWSLLLPIGISFYTFKILSYIFEVNRGKIAAETNFVPFSLYVSFFPQIMSGPIERPQNFLNQVNIARPFNRAVIKDGLLQMLWGFFKKIVLANGLAPYVNYCFSNTASINPSVLAIGATFFYLQLYFDFSGYSDIATGVAKLFNIQTIQNFRYPLFSINIADFWRRWHMSLSGWLTEYLFTPLSIRFRNYLTKGLIFSIMITFLVSGIWHGAGLTFMVWGIINGLLYIPIITSGTMNRNKKIITPQQKWPTLNQFGLIVLNFIVLSLTLVIFKADTLTNAFAYIFRIFSLAQWKTPQLGLVPPAIICLMLASIGLDWAGKKYDYSLKIIDNTPPVIKYLICYAVVALIIFLGTFDNNQFIYNKF